MRTTIDGLRLRHLDARDAGEYHALVRRNTAHLTRLGDYRDEAAASVDDVTVRLSEPSPLRYGIVLHDRLIGRVDLVPVDPPRYGIGYWLSEDATGHGYATAAVLAVLEHARSLGATDVFAGVTHGNDRSVAVLRRLGFSRVAEFDSYDRYHLAVVPEIRLLEEHDLEEIPAAFAAIGWPGKDAALYRSYLSDQREGSRTVLVAAVDGRFAGYLTVHWRSGYEPFRAAGTPEITDLNVLPHLRRRGIARALMDRAEALIAERSPTAGIGVGLYADYAAAHLMYLRRGYLPDGRGVAYGATPVPPGTPVRVDDDLALMMTRPLSSGT
ncbi:GNAT family N-acetyltransferase [Nucisporomicrobium flavum]|jgi:RimJ/RimL family protein N-acetyltransferase|uniref:GNAT family N-acetyltransferase n=1 Tax=Nucisporomicrobium flavum TaxID=2785915 RepID=UPI0018F2E15D|nr:GNAT family N-acetyltransferase [Nucisporomicrobium flavum]